MVLEIEFGGERPLHHMGNTVADSASLLVQRLPQAVGDAAAQTMTHSHIQRHSRLVWLLTVWSIRVSGLCEKDQLYSNMALARPVIVSVITSQSDVASTSTVWSALYS